MALYRVFVPPQTAGANTIHWDLWHVVGSQYLVNLESVNPIVSGAAAVTGVLAVDLYLRRTSAIGTGGTAMTFEGTSLTAMTLCSHDNSQPLNVATISGRYIPTGGATAGSILSLRSVFTEETSGGAYTPALDMVKIYPGSPGIPVPVGTGVSVIQGSVASVGVVGFDIMLSVTAR